MTDERNERIAKNEALFRAVNDRVRELADDDRRPTEKIDLLCECGDGECLEPVSMRPDQYELVRSNPIHFIVARGHEKRGVERVVAQHDGFVVVEKLPGEQEIARSTDPRR